MCGCIYLYSPLSLSLPSPQVVYSLQPPLGNGCANTHISACAYCKHKNVGDATHECPDARWDRRFRVSKPPGCTLTDFPAQHFPFRKDHSLLWNLWSLLCLEPWNMYSRASQTKKHFQLTRASVQPRPQTYNTNTTHTTHACTHVHEYPQNISVQRITMYRENRNTFTLVNYGYNYTRFVPGMMWGNWVILTCNMFIMMLGILQVAYQYSVTQSKAFQKFSSHSHPHLVCSWKLSRHRPQSLN